MKRSKLDNEKCNGAKSGAQRDFFKKLKEKPVAGTSGGSGTSPHLRRPPKFLYLPLSSLQVSPQLPEGFPGSYLRLCSCLGGSRKRRGAGEWRLGCLRLLTLSDSGSCRLPGGITHPTSALPSLCHTCCSSRFIRVQRPKDAGREGCIQEHRPSDARAS